MSQYYYAKKVYIFLGKRDSKEDLHYFNLGIFAMRQKGLKTNKMSIAPAIPLGVMPRWAHIVSFHQGSRLKSDWKLAHFYKIGQIRWIKSLNFLQRAGAIKLHTTELKSSVSNATVHLGPKPCCNRKAKTTVLWLWSRAIIGTLSL